MRKKYVVFIIGVFVACNSKTEDTLQEDIVAKVYDYVLTEEDIHQQMSVTNSSIIDSINATKLYIQDWAKQKLLYRNAQINLDNTDELDKMVTKYKEELYVSYYKNALINKKLDTLVVKKEIDSFYAQNQSSFRLNEVLIKFKYLHLKPKVKSRKRSQIKKLFLSGKTEDIQKILGTYSEYDDYYFNDSTWVSLADVYKQQTGFPELTNFQLSKKEKFIRIAGADRSLYYIYLKDFLKEGDVAPVEYVEPTVKNILLHKNKIQFFNQMEQILIDDAVKQKKYEVY